MFVTGMVVVRKEAMVSALQDPYIYIQSPATLGSKHSFRPRAGASLDQRLLSSSHGSGSRLWSNTPVKTLRPRDPKCLQRFEREIRRLCSFR